MVRNLALIVLILSCVSCRQAEQEADRTKAQLSKLAEAVGADEMVDSVSRSYTESVQPAVNSAKEVTETYAKAVPAIQAAQDATNAASEQFTAAKETVVRRTTYVISKLPDSENELERTIDYYNQQFATWLRNNFITFDQQNFSERKSVQTRYKPRTRPRK